MRTAQLHRPYRLALVRGWAGLLLGLAALALALLLPGVASAEGGWHGVAVTDVNVRQSPSASSPILGQISAGSSIVVVDWVIGEKVAGVNDVWAQMSGGGYVYTKNIAKGKVSAPPSPGAPTSGRWIDVNLTEQIATAYEGNVPTFSAAVSTGTPGWETPTGVFPITRRVANETMDSTSLAVGVAQPYRLENVKWTQYFTQWGHSLHSNYWKYDSPFGVPTSHGCVGMPENDAAVFWDFAASGTSIYVHD
jgi:hypothetical protein